MSKSTKTMLAICLVAFAAACAPKPEPVVMVTEPVIAEPVLNKY